MASDETHSCLSFGQAAGKEVNPGFASKITVLNVTNYGEFD